MVVLVLIHMMEEVSIDCVGIDAFKRHYQVRREPALSFDREHRGKFPLDVFKDREGEHALKAVQFIADEEALLDELEAMQGRMLGRMKRERGSSDDDKGRDEVAAEKYGCDGTGDADDAERPIPIITFRAMVIFSPFPF